MRQLLSVNQSKSVKGVFSRNFCSLQWKLLIIISSISIKNFCFSVASNLNHFNSFHIYLIKLLLVFIAFLWDTVNAFTAQKVLRYYVISLYSGGSETQGWSAQRWCGFTSCGLWNWLDRILPECRMGYSLSTCKKVIIYLNLYTSKPGFHL